MKDFFGFQMHIVQPFLHNMFILQDIYSFIYKYSKPAHHLWEEFMMYVEDFFFYTYNFNFHDLFVREKIQNYNSANESGSFTDSNW